MSHNSTSNLHLDSLVIHGGQSPDSATGAVMPPVSLSTTYAQRSPGENQGFEYTRSHNPTRFAWERCIATIEGSTITQADDLTCGGFAFASGLAAMATALELLDRGDHIIAMDDLYGGSYRLLSLVRERSMGLNITYVDLTDLDALDQAMTADTRMIWIESPTNPSLKVVDLAGVVQRARSSGMITVCDNTFATPLLQRPLEHGVDIVHHSATKYLGGHSDVLGGALVTGRRDLAESLRFLQNAVGAVASPFDSYLTLRGVKTLAVRMRQHADNALAVARFLEAHPKVERTVYPGLPSHPQHDVASRQMQLNGSPCGGGMVTFFIKGGIEESRHFLENVRIFALAESLGGVESLVDHPAIMTHASMPPQKRAELGISDSLVRLSVGIERGDDLIADLEQALAKA